MVFQAYTLFPWLTVRQNVQFGPRQRGVKKAERQQLADHFLDAVGLHGFRDHYPKQLSGGMRQRVAIARALANSPRILLMDEPFGALDAQTRTVMQELLLDIRRKERTTTLFITHDIDEAVFLSDRIFVMTARPGRLKAEIAVPFGPDRDESIRTSPEFFQIRAQVYDLLHAEGKAVVEAEIASGSAIKQSIMPEDILFEETVPPGATWSHILKRGTALRLTDTEGGANAGAIFYNADCPVERLNIPDTLKAQHIARLTQGSVLYSDMGRILCSVTGRQPRLA